ncbi:MAG: dienelactone hydrolase family protein [Bacteroidetes bacterium]|jgi:predicted esterase|nr:dienelactone hydrolase family protein [Bacteroidota bacterium]
MDTKELRVVVRRTARVYARGMGGGETSQLWIALHGYGQLAAHFAQKFEALPYNTHYVLVPEAMSRFYLSGTEGRVGASWMTKEARLDDIADYVAYLDSTVQLAPEGVAKRVVLGFSQGAATAVRWAVMGHKLPDVLVLWAGSFPPDLDQVHINRLRNTEIWLVRGSDDPYISHAQLATMEQVMSAAELEYKNLHYKGGHRLYPEVVMELAQKIG